MRYGLLENRAEEAIHSAQLRCDLSATRSSKKEEKLKPSKKEAEEEEEEEGKNEKDENK